MSKNHNACFSHLMADCPCESPKKLGPLHNSTRIPTKGNLSDWKKFLDFIISNNYRGVRVDLLEITKGTKLEKYCKKKIEKIEK